MRRFLSNIPNKDPWYNIPQHVLEKVGRNLHLQKFHPINILKNKIESHFTSHYFDKKTQKPVYQYFDNLHPKVSTKACFDDLLVPKKSYIKS